MKVLDVAALRDIATGRTFYGRALVAAAIQNVIPLGVPASAYAAALALARSKEETETLKALARLSVVVMLPLDASAAEIVGDTLASSGPAPDLAAGHVVTAALSRGWTVVTDRGHQLRDYNSALKFELLP